MAQGRTSKGGAVKEIILGLGSSVDGTGCCDAVVVEVVEVVSWWWLCIERRDDLLLWKGKGAFVVVGA